MSRTNVMTVIVALATGSGSHANGANRMAANGGYVNGRSSPASVWNTVSAL
jgi:hypothetical protein